MGLQGNRDLQRADGKEGAEEGAGGTETDGERLSGHDEGTEGEGGREEVGPSILSLMPLRGAHCQ